ncbi:hypothetical protein M0R45_014859 [Rubus argutus]|uniref:MHC class II antigen n=1 Tax=Rubus argutus TaxID=59490 RepID=A0AAW1XQD1_RUBAR
MKKRFVATGICFDGESVALRINLHVDVFLAEPLHQLLEVESVVLVFDEQTREGQVVRGVVASTTWRWLHDPVEGGGKQANRGPSGRLHDPEERLRAR